MTYQYVTPGDWGPGNGEPFPDPAILDQMWWETAEALAELQAFMAAPGIPTITGATGDGSTFQILMSSGGPLGPILLPVPKLRYRSDLNSGAWAADSDYLSNDTFTQGGASYFVNVSHHSDATTFDAEATDGLGHKLYGVLAPYAPLALDDLTDVAWNTAGPVEGELIQFLGGLWTNVGRDGLFDASEITFTPSTASSLTSTDVAAALEELEGLIPDVSGFQASDADLDALAANATDGLWAHTGAGTGAARTLTAGNGIDITNGDGVSGNPTIAQSANARIDNIQFVIDGGGSTITTGVKGYIEVPFACTITQATLLADQSGSIVIDIFKCTYADFDAGSTHPVSGDKITESAPPTISSAVKAQDATLTGWTTSVSAGDILAFNVNSVTTVQRATISLKVTHE